VSEAGTEVATAAADTGGQLVVGDVQLVVGDVPSGR